MKFIGTILLILFTHSLFAQDGRQSVIKGTVKHGDAPLEFATIYIKGTQMSTNTDKNGKFVFRVPSGNHVLGIRYVGYATYEKTVKIDIHETLVLHVQMQTENKMLDEVTVNAESPVKRINESAYNVVAIDAKALHNSTLDLAQAMAKISGVKIRESGGLGSDLQFSLNGFTGKHIKFFIDGVPMEGMGASFQINNIPINMAERIEVYKGVVPVGFGGDAIGGAVNIVTNQRKKTYLDASYSYGSFNTHKSSLNFGYTTNQGLMFEINAFQNYSDNSYKIQNAVKNLETGSISRDSVKTIKRFHDTYHNETLIAKIGLVNKSFADRLVLSVNFGKNYNEIQNGVVQDVVFGQKLTKGNTFMPSLAYMKKNLILDGLNVNFTANFNKNIRQNIDTSRYQYNWFGEKILQNGGKLGEQTYSDSKFENKSWNTTFTATYRVNEKHSFTVNDVLTSFDRNTRSLGVDETISATDTMPKTSRKNVLGIAYRFNQGKRWNISAFAKHYLQYAKGPRQVTANSKTSYEIFSETFTAMGYGIAGTYFWKDFQGKLSYEKAYRLPTDNEMFGDEDMEQGSTGLRPENSHNYNINLSYSKNIDNIHFILIDAGFMLRDTKDYIRRVTDAVSGKYFASYINHGKVRNIGFNGEVRYMYKNLISLGGNITSQNLRNNETLDMNAVTSTSYKIIIHNIPYFFLNTDFGVNFNNDFRNRKVFNLTYYSNYVK
ncbi:MAG: carboxypeptidase-like regulatory domain-containing protein, partial [Dysgonomonas sp.]